MSEDRPDYNNLQKKIDILLETIKQVNYQNEMMLKWVNGAVVMVDREGRVTNANNEALATLGWSLEDFIGRHLHETIHHSQDDGSEYPWDFCPVFAALEDGSSHHVDGDVFWQNDGSSFSADFIACPTRDENNEVAGAVLIFRNLTEQRLKEANRVHRIKLESIGVLAAGIAHEINTPIQFIGSNLHFLKESFQGLLQLTTACIRLKEEVRSESAQFADLVNEIKRLEDDVNIDFLQDEAPKAFEETLSGVDRVSKLVLGLKGFAHSSDSEKKHMIDLNDIINNSLIVCQNSYKDIAKMELDLGELPLVKGYPFDIGQVIINLVVNAAHAIADHERQHFGMGSIKICTTCDTSNISISISDTGGGIPEGVQKRIFDPFFTTKNVGLGSGQGLAISRNIIHDKHHGEITFESMVGKGTTFMIRLPLENLN